MRKSVIGVIGGSGLYEIQGLGRIERQRLATPFGDPSDEYVVGELENAVLVFLPRHGRGHRLLPHEINFRANIHGMKQLGVEWIISVSAVGSMREDLRPGDLVVVDQFIDRTKGRVSSFFGGGAAGHIQFADPVCPDLAAVLGKIARQVTEQDGGGARVHQGGTYVVIEGPQFSTRAESRMYRSWGVDVIGMTNLPEAKLAREAEICYATVALVTDYDCWHESEGEVSVEKVLAVLSRSNRLARGIIHGAALAIAGPRRCRCAEAARNALITDPAVVDPETRQRLALIVGNHQ
ncbi:MAG: S-methyl-5'-thioadenosine phosphorylase [Pseudomonadota bacterium]